MNETNTVLDQLLSTLNPFATIDNSIKVNRLPTLSQDERTNKVLWNTIGATGSTFAATTLLTAIMHKINKNKWEKKQQKLLKDKVNALYPISAPNYEAKPSSVSDVRALGLNKKADFVTQHQGRGFFDYLKDIGLDTLAGAVPVAGGITAAAVAPSIINQILSKMEKRKLDENILAKRNRLAALQAHAVEMGMDKNNSAADTSEGFGNWSVVGGVLGAGGTSLLALTLLKYMNSTDNNRRTMKALEDIVAENSTNIPQRISLKLNAEGRPARTGKEQEYIKDMKKVIEEADKPKKVAEASDDFSDKLTYMKKDEIFS
jgi:hypothetical protein